MRNLRLVHSNRRIENLAIIGFMGTGKTSVAHAAASLLHFQMVDTDFLIEKQSGRRISEIFASDGEPRFRQYEREIVAQLAHATQTVISTGGGLAADPENLASLKSHALVVCLWASPNSIWERVKHQTHRPLLNTPDPVQAIRQLLTQRAPFYRQADVLINTETRSIKEVSFQVVHHFRLARKNHPA
jgi:shikimate kinase